MVGYAPPLTDCLKLENGLRADGVGGHLNKGAAKARRMCARAVGLRSDQSDIGCVTDATIALLLARPAGDTERSRDRVASAHAACGHDPSGERWDLLVAAARLARPEEDRADRARGTESVGGRRAADADHPIGRPLARVGPI